MTFGLVGESLRHSYSREIHEGLGEYEYRLFSLSMAEFEGFIAARQYDGLNITIPYKQAVLPLCDRLTDSARQIGAVNTLYFRQGELWGDNTDYQGFLYAARTAEISFEKETVLILGNGGASLAARLAAQQSGASQILTTSRRGEPGCISYGDVPLHRDTGIIINTTPVGMYPKNGCSLLDLTGFPNLRGVMDLIYNPLETDLLQQARRLGIPYANGLSMLVAQATAAAERFTGKPGFQAENEAILRRIEREVENIVLIGMPGCGKTRLGRALAGKLKKRFIDMDEEITRLDGRSIPDIFSESGEAYFRDLETQAARAAGKETSQVIAAGGGTVLRSENMRALGQNGRVVFVQRPLESLAIDGRPLSKGKNTLKSMYEERLPLYNRYSDLTFQSAEGIEKSATDLLSRLMYRRK